MASSEYYHAHRSHHLMCTALGMLIKAKFHVEELHNYDLDCRLDDAIDITGHLKVSLKGEKDQEKPND